MQAWKAAAAEFNVPDIENTVRDCTGTNIPFIAEYWAKKYPDVPFEDYLPRRQFYYFGILEQGIPVKEGAYELLTYLRAHGYKVGMATSTPWDTVKEHLERTDMTQYFDAIVTGDMIEHGKPAPDIYLLAAQRLGVDPAECVGVEDSPNGVRSIHAAGMRAVMIPDLVEPSPEVEALVWRKLDCLMDMIPLLEGEE
jgi:HAD superfamily hydrolase (TIGR01509 family)